jgi:hypothetical protein
MKVPVSDAKARAAGVSERAHIHEAVTNTVTGLEALLNTGEDEPIAAQFVKRSQALATELDVQTSRSYWNWIYDVRSKAVHGPEAHLVVPAGWTRRKVIPRATSRGSHKRKTSYAGCSGRRSRTKRSELYSRTRSRSADGSL